MYRIAGALLIVVGCYLIGRVKFIADKHNIQLVNELIKALNIMICELEFRRPSLPVLCSFVSEHTEGVISSYFAALKRELDSQIAPDVRTCSDLVIKQSYDIPAHVRSLLSLMGQSLGMFGIDGQVDQLRYVKSTAENTLEHFQKRFETFGRSRQTLWICAGIALAVIMI